MRFENNNDETWHEDEIADVLEEGEEERKRKGRGKYFVGMNPEKQEERIANQLGERVLRLEQEKIEELFGYTGDAQTKSVADWIRRHTRFDTSSHVDGTITIWNPDETDIDK